METIEDAEAKVTSYVYDSRNLKTSETYPDHVPGSNPGQAGYGIVQFEHDAASRMFRKTDQLGDTVTFNFDLAGRMTQRDYRTAANSPAGTIADSDVFTHNNSGQTLTATSGRYNNVVTMSYDDAGRLKDESLTISGQTYTVGSEYNTRGQLWKLTYPDGKIVERTYHSDGQLHQVKYDGNLVDTRLYDDGGRLDNSTYGNGVVTDFTYFDDNMLQTITTTNPGANKVGTYAYTWDANKNNLTETITGSPLAANSFTTSGGTDPDGYDDDDRLVYWKHTDNSLTHEWTLTAVGDWANFKVNGTGTARTHSNAHEILTVGAQSLAHDVKGNLTINANGDAYAWDFDNRMTGANTDGNPGDEVTFEYDALGRRVRKDNGTTNTVYILAGQQVLAEYASGAVPSSPSEIYVYASYIDEPIFKTGTGGGVYYSRNQQYSITALTDSTGNVVERYAYDAHGTLAIFDGTGTTIAGTSYANPYTYTARRFDPETDLYYFRARYFDSALGRFIGRDPIGHVDGMSLYRGYFVAMGMDPSGTEWIKKSETKYMATNDEDSLMSLAWKITGDSDDWVCIWPVGQKAYWEHFPYANECAVADVSNLLVPNPQATKYAAIVIPALVGTDKNDPETLAGGPFDAVAMYRDAFAKFFQGVIPVRHPNVIPKDIIEKSGEGATPISRLFVGGHSSIGFGGIIGQWPTKDGSPTWFTFKPTEDLLLYNRPPTLSRAMEKKGPTRCWFTRDAATVFAGCNSGPAAAEPFANEILREGAMSAGVTRKVVLHYYGWYDNSTQQGNPFTSDAWKPYPGKQ